jgi:pseudaminic acid cytidylyltransferase
MRLAVIPARGGSKRIPRKNIRDFCGKPMLAWSVEAAWASGCFDAVVVSTDDHEIAEVARACGAGVPFMRPAELSDDHTGTMAVVRHCIGHFADTAKPASHTCCIYATAPFLDPADLRAGLDMLLHEGADYALAVTSYAFPIQRAVRIGVDHRLTMFAPEQFQTRSQDLEPAWHDAGQFCWGVSDAWAQGRGIFAGNAVAVPLPRRRVQDIDTPEDWARNSHSVRASHEQGQRP